MKKVYDVGINDYDGKVIIHRKIIKSYRVWQGVLQRCYNMEFQKRHPTYIGTTVCDDWLSFSKFKEWFDKNYPYHLEEQGIKLNIDKDLLSGESKIYSPETCVFLPSCVNNFMTNKQLNNKSGYTGVNFDKNRKKWRVEISEFNSDKYKYVGRFTDIEDAGNAYIKAREIEALKVKEYLRELGYDENIINKIK